MVLKKLLLALMILGMLGLAACGDDGGDTGGEATETTEAAEPAEAPAPAEAAAPASPTELADSVMEIYLEGLNTIVAMADNPPPLEDAKAQLATLKEDMIQRLVALGHIRAGMSDADKSRIDSAIGSAFMRVDQEVWTKYNEVLAHYRSQDIDFANVIASFNIITQYADFNLLKQQEPEEAARLGIE